MNGIKNLSEILTLEKAYHKDGRNLLPEDVSIIKDGAVVYNDNEILWVGKTSEIPEKYKDIQWTEGKGQVLTPELVDSHTHTVFGGNRAGEYVSRLNGATYEDIAKKGGGILSTMKHTLEASEQELFETAVERVEKMSSLGVGTLEIKSGYALTYDGEKKLSKIIDKLKGHFKNRVHIFNTYLAAHAVPKNFSSSRKYMDEIVIPLLDELASEKIIDAIDIFHEVDYFDLKDVEKIFKRAQDHGIALKIHADEFNDNGGAVIAAKYNALSADHLLATKPENIKTLAASKTVATFLPGTSLFLGKKLANARAFIDAGAKFAIATDFNPGSCHFYNLPLLASIGASLYKLNQTEFWASITLNAAHALGLRNQGAIVVGLAPSMKLFNTTRVSEISYNWGNNLFRSSI
ncbi:MAG: imidazolonepropionase [Halobacteriovoraceae bacterium]|nr:imidazolonepropionase [Halobacteriovoraceae bacterium]